MWGSKVNLTGPNLTSCHEKLTLLTPLGSKNRNLGNFGSHIPTYWSKTLLERNVFQSQNLHLWNTECVRSGALGRWTGFLSLSVAWDEVFQPAFCCFELKVNGFHLALVFAASLSKVENGVNKPCRICKTFWSIQTKMICCIEDFKVFAGNWMPMLCKRNQSLSCKIF